MNRLKLLFLFMVCCFGFRCSVFSRATSYNGNLAEKRLYNCIRKHKAAVVLLDAPIQKKRQRRTSYGGQKGIQGAFDRLSKSGYYPRKAVGFVKVNIQSPAGKQFIVDNNISISQVPAIVLFSDGVPIENQHGIVTLTGTIDRAALKEHIDAYLNIDIAEYVQEQRAFKQYEDVLKDRAHIYYSPYFSKVANPWNGYWGWPYYGMAQGHYGGNAGIVSTGNGLSFFGANY